MKKKFRKLDVIKIFFYPYRLLHSYIWWIYVRKLYDVVWNCRDIFLWNVVQVSSIINLICVGQVIYQLGEIQFQRADLLPRRFPFTNESPSKSHSLVVLSSLWSSSIISSKPPNSFCSGLWVRIYSWGRGGGDLEFTFDFDSGSANKRRPSQGNFQCSSVVRRINIFWFWLFAWYSIFSCHFSAIRKTFKRCLRFWNLIIIVPCGRCYDWVV